MKMITSMYLMAGIFISCQPTGNLREQNVEEQNTRLLENLMGLWETGDTLKTRDIFSENCVYVDIANNQTLAGIDGANRYIGHVHSWASEVQMEIRKVNVSATMGYVEWTFTARQTNPIKGRVPVATNRDIALKGVTLAEFKDGKIQKASDYMDVLGFVIQLGAEIDLPGGVTIGE